jgi:hypothetical protein
MGPIMNRVKSVAWVVVIGALVGARSASAAAHVDFIDVGTPKSGAMVMSGWRGVIVRISLDNGLPITSLHLGDAFGLGIFGNVAERWTDPQGRSMYTETSPGPLAADNSIDSDFNFDTHFLPIDNVTYDPFSLREGSGAGRSLVTSRSPIPSTPFVGYGATLPEPVTIPDPLLLSNGGIMAGGYEAPAALQLNTIDVAYVVADGLFSVQGRVSSGNQDFNINSIYNVPEPSSLLLTLLGLGAWVGRPRNYGKLPERLPL